MEGIYSAFIIIKSGKMTALLTQLPKRVNLPELQLTIRIAMQQTLREDSFGIKKEMSQRLKK